MLRRLGTKFWLSVMSFLALCTIILQGQDYFRRPAEELTFSDEISVGAAHAEPVLPDSGLSMGVERRVQDFLAQMKAQPSQPDRWVELNQEWLHYARAWFDRVYPGQERFNRYASLWVGKREKIRLWRVNCRNEFFPDMNDVELLTKAEWLQGEEEWQEMQAKITRGLQTVDLEYQTALKDLLGTHFSEFRKLQQLFVKEFLPKNGSSGSYFL